MSAVSPHSKRRIEPRNAAVIATWLVLASTSLALAWPHTHSPGLFYDEAVHAGAAKDFITGHGARHYPGYQSIDVGGRPLPLFIQDYCGALKSWMLVPAIALGGCHLAVFRLASLAWGLLALLLFMLWVRHWRGDRLAIVAGALLAFDPSWFFSTIMDWGPVIPGFVCKFLMFDLALRWYRGGQVRHAFAAAACAGLGFFAKVDFAVVVAGAGVAAAAAFPGIVARIRRRPGVMPVAATGFVLGSFPMLRNVSSILFGLGGSAGPHPPEWPEKIQTFLAMHDGSDFARIWDCGGIFTEMYATPPSVWSPFGLAVMVGLPVLLAVAWQRRLSAATRQAAVFVILATVLTTAGTFGIPGAVRLHHTMSVYPFPHLAVAMAVMAVYDHLPSRACGGVVRLGTAAAVPLLLMTCNLGLIRGTQSLVQATGGRGHWSDSLDRFCAEVRDRKDLTIVSLDWGFNEQLIALTDAPRLVEPIWEFAIGGRVPDRLPTDPSVIYLLHPERYGHFAFNAAFLRAAFALPAEAVEIRSHRDRENEIAFYSVRFRHP